MKPILTALATLLLCLGAAGAGPPPAQAAPPDLSQARRFVTYGPRSFSVSWNSITDATPTGIRNDLTLLRPWFDGLVTYSANHGQELIPALAKQLGYRAVILGIWDPRSQEEIDHAIQAAQKFPKLIIAVAVGNEGLYTKRYQRQDLKRAISQIKRACPQLAVTTSEPFFMFLKGENQAFFRSLDLLMPNVHPVFEPWFKPSEPRHGVEMVLNVAAKLQETYPSLPLLIKETGMPSGLAASGFTPARQAEFWTELLRRFPFSPTCSLACFEAFDAPWKPKTVALNFPGNHANEAFWGFFTAAGQPKPVIESLPKLSPP